MMSIGRMNMAIIIIHVREVTPESDIIGDIIAPKQDGRKPINKRILRIKAASFIFW